MGLGWGNGVLAALPPLSGGWAPAFPDPHSPGGSRVSLRLQGWVLGSPRMGFPNGGWGVLSLRPRWGSPFLFYTINLLHQHLLPARPCLPLTTPQPRVQRG